MLLRARGPSGRFPRFDPVRVDELVGLALLLAMELQVWLGSHVNQRAAEALAAVAISAAVMVRRRWPFAALLVVFVAVPAQDALGGRLTQSNPSAILALILVFYGAGAFLETRRACLALVVVLLGSCLSVMIETGQFSDFLFTGTFLVALPWGTGRFLRERGIRERAHRERAEQLDAVREQRASTAASGERARIARELHDVIAHSVSVMVIQAAGARTVMDSEPDRADASLRSVERAGREALAEMRRLLGALDGGRDPRALAPQPGLADIEDLLARTRAAGLTTDLLVEGAAAPLSPALDLCAYRIVQEALTNAIKHAGPASAEVRVRWECDALELEVIDDGCGPAAENGFSGGHGIAGMRERAALHGGSIQAGAGSGRGFAVRARLPLVQEQVQ
ncbi:MAG TPA: sensor histidine kinase [Solirubrobacteraceae bacterium]|nr:sensor histidine kinase [Solirubrobacteraceae bacterium]